jgi:phosphoribosyl 1,2-cyclic phosphodiesterase
MSGVGHVSSESRFAVRFWGVRGTLATPGAGTVRYGGNTSCLEVRCGQHLFVFDAGTGLRELGQELMREQPLDIDLYLSHTHYDHVSGLPFFAPAFVAGNQVRVWEGHLGDALTLRGVLEHMMTPPLFPVPVNIIEAACNFHKFAAGDTLTPRPGVAIHTAPLTHPNEAVGYRIEYGGRAICYVTDTEHEVGRRNPIIVELARGADLLIYDSTYSDAEYELHRGWGHSTWQECCRVAAAAEVKTAVIFHHDPSHDDTAMDAIAAGAAALRPGTIVAREGMVLEL